MMVMMSSMAVMLRKLTSTPWAFLRTALRSSALNRATGAAGVRFERPAELGCVIATP